MCRLHRLAAPRRLCLVPVGDVARIRRPDARSVGAPRKRRGWSMPISTGSWPAGTRDTGPARCGSAASSIARTIRAGPGRRCRAKARGCTGPVQPDGRAGVLRLPVAVDRHTGGEPVGKAAATDAAVCVRRRRGPDLRRPRRVRRRARAVTDDHLRCRTWEHDMHSGIVPSSQALATGCSRRASPACGYRASRRGRRRMTSISCFGGGATVDQAASR